MSKQSRRTRAGRQAAATLRVMLLHDGAAPALLATARVTGGAGLPMMLTWRTFLALCHELGGHTAAWAFVLRLATESGKPCFVNGPRRDGQPGSSTVAIPPADPSWTQERLCGFVAGFKDEIEATFGETDGRPDCPGRVA